MLAMSQQNTHYFEATQATLVLRYSSFWLLGMWQAEVRNNSPFSILLDKISSRPALKYAESSAKWKCKGLYSKVTKNFESDSKEWSQSWSHLSTHDVCQD